jgi:hypothetical protein
MRPIYETQADLRNEAAVVEILSQKWRVNFHKLPIKYHLDYAATRNGKVTAYVEVKVRKYTMAQIGKWGGYMLSVGKLQTAKQLCEISSATFCLAVQCADGPYWIAIKDFSEFPVVITGRTDRGDAQDVEPCVLIPAERFTSLVGC